MYGVQCMSALSCLESINWFAATHQASYVATNIVFIVVEKSIGIYHDIAIATRQYYMYTTARHFDLHHWWATK